MKKMLFSEKLNKYYDINDEATLVADEKAYDDRMAEADRKKKARAERAKEVENAYKAAVNARNKADELANAFIKDYGSFHLTLDTPRNKSFVLDDLMKVLFNPLGF